MSDNTKKKKVAEKEIPQSKVARAEGYRSKDKDRSKDKRKHRHRKKKVENEETFDLKKCKVRFELAIKRHDILNREAYTEQEIKRCWSSLEENLRVEKQKQRTLDCMERGEKSRSDSTRGLEGWTTKGEIDLDGRVSGCISAVLKEQGNQRALGEYDSERLCRVSRENSKRCTLIALKLAKYDARDAQKFHRYLENRDDTSESVSTEPTGSKYNESKNRNMHERRKESRHDSKDKMQSRKHSSGSRRRRQGSERHSNRDSSVSVSSRSR